MLRRREAPSRSMAAHSEHGPWFETPRGACHRAALCADPLARLLTMRLTLRRSARRRRRELKRHAIHAIAQTGRLRAILEHVPKMSAAAAAMRLGAGHEEGPVDRGADRIRQRLPEARPAGAALIFRIRG